MDTRNLLLVARTPSRKAAKVPGMEPEPRTEPEHKALAKSLGSSAIAPTTPASAPVAKASKSAKDTKDLNKPPKEPKEKGPQKLKDSPGPKPSKAAADGQAIPFKPPVLPSERPSTTGLPSDFAHLPALFATLPGFADLIAGLQRGRSGTIDGAYGSSAALTIAALAQATKGSLLVAMAHVRDMEGLAADLESFTGATPALFPITGSLPGDTRLDREHRERLALISKLKEGHREGENSRIILAPISALMQPVPSPDELASQSIPLIPASTVDPEELAKWLVSAGYTSADIVEKTGEFARRGGIMDIFSPDRLKPLRLEFFGDELESVREFHPETQRSELTLPKASLMPLCEPGTADKERAQAPAPTGNLIEHLPPGSWAVLWEPVELDEQAKAFAQRMEDVVGLFSVEGVMLQLTSVPSVVVSAFPAPSFESMCRLPVESVERFSGSVERIRDELDQACGHSHVMIAVHGEAESRRLNEVLAAGQLAKGHLLHLIQGKVQRGFRIPGIFKDFRGKEGGDGALVVLGGQELFHKDVSPVKSVSTRKLESRAIDSFLDLDEGDFVVHVSHGIAKYLGMRLLDKSGASGKVPIPVDGSRAGGAPGAPGVGQAEEHLVLEFRDGVKLYVPATRIDLVQKYVGGSKAEPELSKFGGTHWQKRKEKVQEAVLDLAADMIALQAKREGTTGSQYPPDSDWQRSFEAGFGHQETPDQLNAIGEIKGDMQRARPMDRLVCGDVGYGKTELALRAAFKAVDNGRQVAILVPTTVLAEQHYRNFSRRFADFPFTVGSLNRFRTPAEVRDTLKGMEQGSVDVVIGTHRLLSQDIRFKDLGLLIIDEEQRFGVEHKERLKQLRETVDVLTLTATPIPRTLHLSLLGIRDISNLETPPPDRLAVETRIIRFDETLIKNALVRELNREGQAFFVHPRVVDIEPLAERIRRLVPQARIAVAHGQMHESDLESAMVKFIRREADLLISTTIIESGLDIPSANTIFVNEADHYGLADLHQLRGRVGRSRTRAYAYFLLDGRKQANPQAVRRLKAIEEFAELGAGFKIALRDLEIRGAGNILGTQQSGHIASVGYELYCQLLENAVRGLKNQPARADIDVTIDLPWPAYLPRDYVPVTKQRLEVYRRLARIRRFERIEDFRTELTDRFGPLPEPVTWLLKVAETRLMAARWNIPSIHLDRPESPDAPIEMILTYRDVRKAHLLAGRSNGRLKVVDGTRAYCRLKKGETDPEKLFQILRFLLKP